MSEDLSVKLYFSNGQIRYGDMELTCQNLIRLTTRLEEQPQELGGPLPTFFRAFHVDAEQHDLSIMALINRSESLYWELMPL
jgi:hypothetical protein